MKKLMHILFLSCLKATELIEKKFHFHLTFRERMQLKMHTSMCKACSMYKDQSATLNKALSKIENLNGENENPESLKEEILKKLQNHHSS
jgi:cyanate lyase